MLFSFFYTHGKRKPNFVVIVSESHPVSAFGAYKGYLSKIDPTPNLDHLALKSFLFKNAFCTDASSVSSSAVLLSGQYSHGKGFFNNEKNLQVNKINLPKILQKQGY